MMLIKEFLSHFHNQDVKLWVDGGQLHYSAPEGILTPALKSQLRERKSEIIEFLQNTDLTSIFSITPILPAPRNVGLPLSFSQQRLWFLQQLEPNNSFYNESAALQLIGTLDIAALEQSLNRIVQRHEALRTTFDILDGQPVQIIASNLTLTLPVVDLRQLKEAEQSRVVQRLSLEQSQRLFDLVRGPLLRCTLLQLSDQKYVLLLTMHHIIGDVWSGGVLISELSFLYQTFTTGKSISLPELPIQYADFAVWQRQELKGEKLQSQLSYWKQQLENAPPLLQLPTDRPRPPVQTYQGAKQSFRLPKGLTEALKEVGRKAKATLFMTLLAAFKILLYRYSGQADIIVGSPIANRTRAEIEGLIGFFVNTLVLRTPLSGNPTFEDLLGRVRKVMIGAYANQDLPFEKLVEELQPERDVNYNPLFQVAFSLQNTPRASLELPGLLITPFELESTRAVFDLRLEVVETGSGLEGFWEYNTDLFDAARICRMNGHFQILLEAIADNLQQRINQLPLLSEIERHQLLVEFNQTQTDYPKDTCIHKLFEAQVEKTPDSVALVFAENQQLTYHELNQRANQLAYHLQSLGVGPEVLVGICVKRSLEMVVGLLGILKAGGAYVPLDPNYPAERLSYMLSDAGVEVLLTEQSLLDSLQQNQAQVVCLDADGDAIWQHNQDNLDVEVRSDNLAYVVYTSGSTGKPKGVSIIHQGIVRLVKETNYVSLTSQEVFLQLAPISFDASTFEIWGSLLNGAKLVIMCAHTPTLKESAEVIEKYKVTTLWLTASLFHLMVEQQLEKLKSVRQLLAGGEVLSPPHVERVIKFLPGCQLINGYGPTENTTFTCCYRVKGSTVNVASISIGRPIANTQVYILDRHLQLLPIGVPGELYAGGDGLARDYLNRPELTQERFIPNLFNNSKLKTRNSRLYKTGDLAQYLPDGNIEFLGRIDHQVKIRGFRIELGEIETALLQHPAVNEVVVLVREDKPSDKRITAYLVFNQQQAPTINQLQSFLRQKLPNYMIPSAFVVLDAIPLTSNGKTNRHALPAPKGRPDLEETYVMPETEAERIIATVWQEILQLEEVGINDNFFSMGGHSLLIVRVQAKLSEILDKEISLLELFKYPTIKELAQYLTHQADAEKAQASSSKAIYDRAIRQREAMRKRKYLSRQQGRKANG